MNTQQIVIVLLVIAIVISAINVVVSLGFDVNDYAPAEGGETEAANGAGQVVLTVLPNGGNA
jgi:hypothetical protein